MGSPHASPRASQPADGGRSGRQAARRARSGRQATAALLHTTCLLLFNVILLDVIAVDVTVQLRAALGLAVVTIGGLAILGPRASWMPDRISLCIIAALTGMAVFTGVSFVAFHFAPYLLWSRLASASLTIALAGLAWWRRRTLMAALPGASSIVSPSAIAFLSFLATLLAVGTVYGFNAFAPVPSWGLNWDLWNHLYEFVMRIRATDGLPEATMRHNAVQVLLIGLTNAWGHADVPTIVAYHKVIGFTFYFCLLYLTVVVARAFFGLSEALALLSALAVSSWGPLTFPFIPRGTHGNFLGYFDANRYYHNTTTLMSTVIGLGAIVLILLSTEQGRRTFAWGAALVSVSFFFKPSFFTVLAPTLFVLIPLYDDKLSRDKLIGYALLMAVPVVWFGYMQAFGVPPAQDVTLRVAPFRALFYYSGRHLPGVLTANGAVHAAVLFLASFAVFVPIALDGLRRIGANTAGWRRRQLVDVLRGARKELLFSLLMLLGLVQIILFYQTGRQFVALNFGWALCSAFLAFMPVIVKAVSAVRSPWLRRSAYVLLCLHIWAGTYRFVHIVQSRSP